MTLIICVLDRLALGAKGVGVFDCLFVGKIEIETKLEACV
jgi:hypothetical protein